MASKRNLLLSSAALLVTSTLHTEPADAALAIYAHWHNPDRRSTMLFCDFGFVVPGELGCLPGSNTELLPQLPDALGGLAPSSFNTPHGKTRVIALTETFGATSGNPTGLFAKTLEFEPFFAGFPGPGFSSTFDVFVVGERNLATLKSEPGFGEAVGFGVGHADADGEQDFFVAHAPTSSEFEVNVHNGATGVRTTIPFAIAGMNVIAARDEASDFLGFFVGDDNADGISEFYVLRKDAPGFDSVIITVTDQLGNIQREILLDRDPIAQAVAARPARDVHWVTGFTRGVLVDGSPEEWLIATSSQDLPVIQNGQIVSLPGSPMSLDLSRFDLTGTHTDTVVVHGPPGTNFASGNPSLPEGDTRAFVVGIATVQARGCTNCKDSSACTEDADGDGLPDIWEEMGVDVDCDGDVVFGEGDLPIHHWGADSQHKDLFLELDWVLGEEPTRTVVQSVKAAFAAAPVTNPDGTTGINLWVDAGILNDPTVWEDGFPVWNNCSNGMDDIAPFGVPDGADGADANDACLRVGDAFPLIDATGMVTDPNGGNRGNQVAFNPNDVVSTLCELDAVYRDPNNNPQQDPSRVGIFRYGLNAPPPSRVAPAGVFFGRPDAFDPRLAEDGVPGACGDGIDQGTDGADGADASGDCSIDPERSETVATATDPNPGATACTIGGTLGNCMNGIDDDGDGFADGMDPDCTYTGGWGGSDRYIDFIRNAATMMHELGHTLGLLHGGPSDGADGSDADCINPTTGAYNASLSEDGYGTGTCGNGRDDGFSHNCKPNYVSIMSYAYPIGIPQSGVVAGTDIDEDGAPDLILLDFSPPRFAQAGLMGRGVAPLAALNETALVEAGLVQDTTDGSNRFVFQQLDNLADMADPECYDMMGVYQGSASEDGAGANSCQDGMDNSRGRPFPWGLNNDNDGDGIVEQPGIDWNGDGVFSATPIAADIDALNACSPAVGVTNVGVTNVAMQGAHDWNNLSYKPVPVDQVSNQVLPPEIPIHHWARATEEARREAYQADLALNVASSCIALPAAIDVTIDNFGPNPAVGTKLDIGLPASAFLTTLPPGCAETTPGLVSCSVGVVELDQSVTLTLELDGDLQGPDNPIVLSVSHIESPDVDPRDNTATIGLLQDFTTIEVCHADPQTVDVTLGAACAGELVRVGSRELPIPVPLNDGNVDVVAGRTYTILYEGDIEQQVEVVEVEGVQCCEAGQTVIQGTSQGDQISPVQEINYCVLGFDGGDAITTNSGDDLVFAGRNSDSVLSDAGNDRFFGGQGQDQLTGGPSSVLEAHGGPDGDHLSAVHSESASLWGGPGADHLTGSVAGDEIFPGSGADFVFADAGSDTVTIYDVCEATPGKELDGGAGFDVLFTPVPVSELVSRGVTVSNFEEVIVTEVQSYLSDCFSPCGSLPLHRSGATSSSNESSAYLPSNAIDSSTTTRWSSAFSDPQWIAVDLGSLHFINRVVLNWEAAYSKKYRIEVSSSASGPWTTVFNEAAGNGGIDDIEGFGAVARYVRMSSTMRGTPYGNSLFDFAVYGDTDTTCAGPIELSRTSAVSSSNESGALAAANAIDGNLATRWSSLFSSPQWIYVDLGATRTIRRVVLNWEAAFSSKYDVQVSDDTSTWTTLYSDEAGNGGIDEIGGLNATGRYVRMFGRARGTAYGHSLWEFQVFGIP